jgi:transposase
MNTKLHAVTDTSGRPIRFFLTAGQVSDYTGAAALLSSFPEADWLLADRGYDADWFREALSDRGTRPCIPGRKSRKKLVRYDKRRYKRRNRIERMFGRLKDWRRVATRYDRCPKVFLSAIALAATVIFWLWVLNLVRHPNTSSGINLDFDGRLSGVTQATIPSEGPYQPLRQWGAASP